jgi:NitT/TauT family transport system substrate-binding protein
MMIARRALLLAVLSGTVAASARAAARPTVRVGLLRLGTVSWELDVIRRHGFDAEAAIAIEPVQFATAQATQTALQAGRVDMVVLDWLWVSRQRGEGADWTFVPFSSATGALVVPAGSLVRDLPDLKGRRLGIAGSPLDKSWLILRAYAKERYGFDPDEVTQKSFGAPSLLLEEAKLGRLDAMLNFWPFAAKAEAIGMRAILPVADAVRGLGIEAAVPFIGYVFSQAWADRNQTTLVGFLAASRKARNVLASSDAEWQSLMPLTGAADQAELDQLRGYYRRGIPKAWGPAEQQAAGRLYEILAKIGGPTLVGSASTIAPGTFWPAASP